MNLSISSGGEDVSSISETCDLQFNSYSMNRCLGRKIIFYLIVEFCDCEVLGLNQCNCPAYGLKKNKLIGKRQ